MTDDQNNKETVVLETISSTDLFKLELKPPPMIVSGLVATGLNILGGNPKGGKSFAALQLAHAVATGGYFLGNRCESGRVLYLALEDTLYRLKHRMQGLKLQPSPVLEFAIESRTLKTGGMEAVWAYLHRFTDTKLVIIDTLARVKDAVVGQGNAYESDSQLGAALQRLAFESGTALLVVHHLSKIGNKDFLLSLSGSAGLPGAADVVMGLERQRNDQHAKLHVTGRDIEERTLQMNWTPVGWQLPLDYQEEYGRRFN